MITCLMHVVVPQKVCWCYSVFQGNQYVFVYITTQSYGREDSSTRTYSGVVTSWILIISFLKYKCQSYRHPQTRYITIL